MTPDPGIRVQEDEVAKDLIARADLRPVINGIPDDIRLAAHALAEKSQPIEGREKPAEYWREAFDAGFAADYEATRSPNPTVARRAIMRLAARCCALLALDEVCRGEEVVGAEAAAPGVFG